MGGEIRWKLQIPAAPETVLFPLKAYFAFGVDLKNHDRDRLWDDGYADA